MAFTRRREILGIYSTKGANPNGDPLRGNEPRMDDETGRLLVSDVRIKRTIRDQWDRDGKVVFVKVYDSGEAKSLKERYEEPDIGGTKGDSREVAQEKLRQCIDVRLFGITFAPKGMDKAAFSWTGPVQVSWGSSLHRVKTELVQGTAAFASGEGKSQRSLRTEWRVPFAIISFYAVANQYASQTTGATEEDIDELRRAWWLGTKNLITRSKLGHKPLLWLEIVYKDDYKGLIGDLTAFVKLTKKDGSPLTPEEEQALRGTDDIVIDLSSLASQIERHVGDIETIILVKDDSIDVSGIDSLGSLITSISPAKLEG